MFEDKACRNMCMLSKCSECFMQLVIMLRSPWTLKMQRGFYNLLRIVKMCICFYGILTHQYSAHRGFCPQKRTSTALDRKRRMWIGGGKGWLEKWKPPIMIYRRTGMAMERVGLEIQGQAPNQEVMFHEIGFFDFVVSSWYVNIFWGFSTVVRYVI